MVAGVGPEQPTIAEKFVRLFHLPYFLGCIIWALVLLEIPILLERHFRPHEPISGQGILYLIVIFFMSVYFPLSVRYVRTKLLEAEPKISSVLPDGEADYHKTFGRAVSYLGQILVIIAILFMAIYVIVHTGSMTSRVINSICAVYIATMLGSLIWFNLGCIIGLYQLGGKSLKFKSFREDPKMGTRPMGSLCLSLSGAYFVGVILLILFSATSPNELYKIPYLKVIYAVLILVGLAMFFIPLYRVHLRMVEERNRQELLIQRQFDVTSNNLKSSGVENQLNNIQVLLSLVMADRKLQSTSTWPFDTSLLGQLFIFLLPVIAAAIATYVAELIRINL